jgi:hypothetical protein
MNRLFTLLGKMPFSGKIAIRKLYYCMHQTKTQEDRTRAYNQLRKLLLASVAIHYIGSIGFAGTAAYAYKTNILFAIPLFALATVIFQFVAYAQSSLLREINFHYKEGIYKILSGPPECTRKDKLATHIFTQISMLSLLVLSFIICYRFYFAT